MVVRTKDDGADKYRQHVKTDRWEVPILEARHRQAPEQGYMQSGSGLYGSGNQHRSGAKLGKMASHARGEDLRGGPARVIPAGYPLPKG